MALTLKKGFVETAGPGKYCDTGGTGLRLVVQPSGSRSWVQRITIDRERVELGLGGYPKISLPSARDKARRNRVLVDSGEDPRMNGNRPRGAPTFTEALNIVIEQRSPSWRNPRSEAQWRASMRDFVLPYIGKKPISTIKPFHVLDVLRPFWYDKNETARRLRDRIRAVMRWAVLHGYRKDNPAGDVIKDELRAWPKNDRTFHAAVPFVEVGAALNLIRATEANSNTVLCLEFMVLTACRSREARAATWDEIDLVKAIWTIPAEHTKSFREHLVPLSSHALDVLRRARQLRDGSRLVFPGTGGRKPLSDSTISKLMRENGIKGVPHGFRSTFRDWARETGKNGEAAEAALAHTPPKVEASYARGKLLGQRCLLMQAWGDFVYNQLVSCLIN